MPFVPRSIALVRPPVCLERWKLRSSLSRWSKTLHATRRIAFCATLAKTAFRISWNSAAPIRVAPSRIEGQLQPFKIPGNFHTCHDHRTANGPGCATKSDKVNIHGINNVLEVKRHLYIQDLWRTEFPYKESRVRAKEYFWPNQKSDSCSDPEFCPQVLLYYRGLDDGFQTVTVCFAVPLAIDIGTSPSLWSSLPFVAPCLIDSSLGAKGPLVPHSVQYYSRVSGSSPVWWSPVIRAAAHDCSGREFDIVWRSKSGKKTLGTSIDHALAKRVDLIAGGRLDHSMISACEACPSFVSCWGP